MISQTDIDNMAKPTRLHWLNRGNNTGYHQFMTCQKILEEFEGPITALEIGCAYGGAVEAMAKVFGDRGTVYGFDTFEGHPKDLADDPTSMEALCMDPWYHDSMLGTEGLDIEYQRKALKEEGVTNAHLVKGRVNEHSFDEIANAHFVMIDLDLVKPTKIVYEAIKDKVVKGGYLFLHDAVPPDHLPLLHEYIYSEIIHDGRWELYIKDPKALLLALKRI